MKGGFNNPPNRDNDHEREARHDAFNEGGVQ